MSDQMSVPVDSAGDLTEKKVGEAGQANKYRGYRNTDYVCGKTCLHRPSHLTGAGREALNSLLMENARQ